MKVQIPREADNYFIPGIFETKTILIAEDDETNFFLLHEYLEFTKAEIIWVQNGQEAVEEVQRNDSIDIILMDIQMPVMDGKEAMKKIKEIKPHIPIIALTAYALAGDRENGLKMGFNEYASKPIGRKFLLELILKYI